MAFTPTEEQRQAVTLFNTGGPLKISAFAGSGKTSWSVA
jgi:superfamily I DNA/RNA helicase